MTEQSYEFCCAKFEDAVRHKVIVHAEAQGESEWLIDGHRHIYFCPFCGTDIKGIGGREYNFGNDLRDDPERRRL
jgi:hypothetical protein